MNKPLTLQIQEFKEELVKTINSFNLPAYVIKNELTNIYNEITRLEEEEIEKYNSQKESEEHDEN